MDYDDRVAPFAVIDLEGITFRRVPVFAPWNSLATLRPSFYSPDSLWVGLQEMAIDEIPEGAYMAILYQCLFPPDERLLEGWRGVRPCDIARKLGPRLRDTLLIFLESGVPRIVSQRHNVYGLAGNWPHEISAPILERALQAGWHQSLTHVPESRGWVRLLERYATSPFGHPRESVRWYNAYLQRQRR